jgi:hypothetical protein
MKKSFLLLAAFLVFNILAATENNIRLIIPPAVYSVPGNEMNIYFDNIVLVPNINNYLFDVDCSKGRQDKTRWRFIPEAKDVGKYPLSIKVLNEWSKEIASEKAELFVTPANAGEGKDISLMIVGY